ncbi:MAG: hypothetical protein DYG92_05915 [Leptolyngbya sp. PLA1]|nr:hypothetical protein [Leptolyngbya sp. PLA1]
MNKIALVATAALALALGACASNKSSQSASMGVVNSKCPIVPSHASTTKTVVEFKGQKVGLCCAGCIAKWNALSDADKQARLDAAK